MYKYFSTLHVMYRWNKIFPYRLTVKEGTLKTMEEFEKYVVRNICNYVLFKPSLNYMSDDLQDERDQQYMELDVKNYLVNYGKITEYKGKMSDLYKEIKSFLAQ